MLNTIPDKRYTAQLRILFFVVLFEYALFIFSGVSFSSLNGDRFFDLGPDPAFWLIYGLKLPQFITGHYWLGIFLDALIVLLLLLFIRNPYNNKMALLLFLLLFLFYTFLMGYLTHRNYQVGFFVVFIPFIFKKDINKHFAFDAVRYFLLFFYLSAAWLKFFNGSLSDPAHFSHMLSSQFSAYFIEDNTGVRTNINLYLIAHPKVGYTLYLGSFFIELATCIGFFTKRFDKWLALLLLSFHFMNWLIMDIAPFGHLAFISLLFLSNYFKLNKTNKIP
ncbi:MAG: hypothetical protein QM737_21435 [Ferruginibacter sp.]